MGFIILILWIVLILYILVMIVLNMEIEIDVKKLKLALDDTYLNDIKVIEKEIIVRVILFKKLKFLNIKIGEEKSKFFNIKFEFDFFERLKEISESKWSFTFEILRKVKPRLKNINLKIEVGTEDLFLTVGLVPVISVLLGVFINAVKCNENSYNFNYIVIPQYTNSNCFKIDLDGKIRVKTLSIIIFVLLRKKVFQYNIEK